MFMGLPVTFLSYWGVFIVFENTLSVPVVFQCNCMTCACILSHFSCVWLFATSWTVACQAPLWDSPGKNTGVGCYFLLQGIFPTQGPLVRAGAGALRAAPPCPSRLQPSHTPTPPSGRLWPKPKSTTAHRSTNPFGRSEVALPWGPWLRLVERISKG